MVLSLVAVLSLLGLADRGVSVLFMASCPPASPTFDLTQAGLRDLNVDMRRQLVSLAFACFLLSYIESISAARTFALKHRYEVDARRELLGLGLQANLLAGLFQGYPSAGGLSQSAVNEKAGARTPCSLGFTSLALASGVVVSHRFVPQPAQCRARGRGAGGR